jgi:hypothetical protein
MMNKRRAFFNGSFVPNPRDGMLKKYFQRKVLDFPVHMEEKSWKA